VGRFPELRVAIREAVQAASRPSDYQDTRVRTWPLAIYDKAMDRRDGEPDRLAALIGRPHRETTGNGTAQGVEKCTVAGSIAA